MDFRIAKTEQDKQQVFGWANVAVRADGTQVEDLQGDIIDVDDLEKAAYDHVLHFRSTGERHDPGLRQKGRLIESCVFTKEKQDAIGIPPGIVPEGWWVGYKIDDPVAWEKIKRGEYLMFSIEGKGKREEIKKARRDYDQYPGYDEWLEENLDASREEQREAAAHYREKRRGSLAKSYAELRKFNPYHDRVGRFSDRNGFAMFSPGRDPKQAQRSIDRENQLRAAEGEDTPVTGKFVNILAGKKKTSTSGYQAARAAADQGKKDFDASQKPKGTKEALGFSDYDSADYHQLYNGRGYYAQQKLSPAVKQAVNSYLDPTTEPGSLYNFSQNMNYAAHNGTIDRHPQYKAAFDKITGAMHNLGYNVTLTRYDHGSFLDDRLAAAGISGGYQGMSVAKLKKALVGQSYGDKRILSTSYNDFASAANHSTFTTREVKITYLAKASTKAMMPGDGKGGKFGEMLLAPTSGKSNAYRIVDVKSTGKKARAKGSSVYNLNRNQIEVVVEVG